MKRLLAAIALSATTLASAVACGASDQDAASGPPADGPPASAHAHPTTEASPQPLRSGERFVPLTMASRYTPRPPGGGSDDYRCMLLDPGVTTPVFLTGVQFRAEDPTIVHHAVTSVIPPDQVPATRAEDARTPGEGYSCFGGMATRGQVDTWTPGGVETLFDGDMGYPLAPGSLLLVQIHYNMLAVPAGTDVADRSGIRLRLTDGTPDTRRMVVMPVAAPVELPCRPDESGPLCDRSAAEADLMRRVGPAGTFEAQLLRRCGYDAPEPGDTQTCEVPAPVGMTVHATRPHMHLLGRAIKVELNPGKPDARVLLDVPDYNFDDQAVHKLSETVTFQPGDSVRTTCTHDAGLRKRLPLLRNQPPRYVIWGEGTTDEMCAPSLIMTAPA